MDRRPTLARVPRRTSHAPAPHPAPHPAQPPAHRAGTCLLNDADLTLALSTGNRYLRCAREGERGAKDALPAWPKGIRCTLRRRCAGGLW